MRNKVLVIGGSGDIGKEIVNHLKKDYEVDYTYYSTKSIDSLKGCFYLDLQNPDTSNIYSYLKSYYAIVFASGQSNDLLLMQSNSNNIINQFTIDSFSPLLLIKSIIKNNDFNLKKIIFISSVSGDIYRESIGLYSFSKSSTIALTKFLSYELRNNGICVNAISSGWCNTKMSKKVIEQRNESISDYKSKNIDNNFVYPIEIANLCYYLLGPYTNHISGQIIEIESKQHIN